MATVIGRMLANYSNSHEWLLPTILLLLLPLLCLLLKNKKTTNSNLPPTPPKLPIIGNLHQLVGGLAYRSFHRLSQKHGPIMLLQLGSVPAVVVSSATMAKEVMKTNDLDCCTRPASPGPKKLSYNYLDIAFAPYNDYWKEMRKLFMFELMSPKRSQSIWFAREAEVDKLLDTLAQESGNPVKLDDKIFGLVDGVIGTVAFGKIYGKDKFQKQFQKVLNEVMDVLGSFSAEDFFPLTGRSVDKLTGLSARREKIFVQVDAYLQKMLDLHLDPARSKPEQEDLVDILIELWRNQTSSVHLTADHVKAILLDTFLGAIDTSAITILWTMSELMKNPRVMSKLQAEIRTCTLQKPKVLSGDDVAELKYLKMVAKETLRLHPPAPLLLPRETMRHCKLGAYDVYPKTRIYVNAWAIGRDPKSWRNPDEFYPERFEDTDVNFKGYHFELVPFGAGRRICPGLAMGAANVEYTLANLLYWFDWELPGGMTRDDINMEDEGGLVVHKKIPLCLVPIKYCRAQN